ncbi:hypothetical protein LOAG_02966 [Loa loa]|uniref:Uncharacterized protein n=1 Tax=Loa loa TaxID=7209 RepID=A0A1S0U5T4_LOALO|nr:hypothetical protein LOAG_02966 [Loa loa]EFO25514.1 hypothetical protein LOAG_02966 [Loa loa]
MDGYTLNVLKTFRLLEETICRQWYRSQKSMSGEASASYVGCLKVLWRISQRSLRVAVCADGGSAVTAGRV